jgi:hypothetical protein
MAMASVGAALAQQELTRITRFYEDYEAKAAARTDVRHRCFLAHHAEDSEEVLAFVEAYQDAIIPISIGVEDDDFIDSQDDDYVIGQIRSKYLGASTVTIVMVGQCTWARKYVDWEIYSSLRSSSSSTVNGLMSVRMPSGAGAKRPPRLDANIAGEGGEDGYARAYGYPSSKTSLRKMVEDAFGARTSRSQLIAPATSRWTYNRSCP